MVNKVISLDEAVSLVRPGSVVAMSGTLDTTPMDFVRALIRAGATDLRYLAVPTAALNLDLLVGAGVVREAETSQVALGEFGSAPRFRQAVQSGRLTVREHT
jgi:glutaconate CoA-transferase subunit A